MSLAALITPIESQAKHSALPRWLLLSRVARFCTALFIIGLPVIYCLGVVGLSWLAAWHIHLSLHALHLGSDMALSDIWLLLKLIAEGGGAVLLMRQLLPRHDPPRHPLR